MAAQIIQFRKYQKSRELAQMHTDIESRLAKLREIAARLFDSFERDLGDRKGGPPTLGN